MIKTANGIDLSKIKEVNELIQFSRNNSSIYSDKYIRCPNIIASYEDLRMVPFTTSNDFINNAPKYDMLTSSPENAYVFTSGGTSGEPKIIFLTPEELKRNIAYHGYGYKRAGITSNDIVGTFGIPGYLTSEFTVYLGLEHTKCLIVPLGINSDPEKLLYYLRLFNVNTLLVMPSDIIPLIQYLEQTGQTLNIEKVIYGGEKMYPSTQTYIQKALGVQHFGAVFQSMDVGTIGYQCNHCDTGEYHLHEDIQFAEFLDDQGNYINNGETGELIITNLNRRLMPVIRYKTSDLVELFGRECPCGDTNIKFRLVGRIRDFIKFGGEQLSFKIISEILSEYEGLTGVYQIELTKEKGIDKLLLKVEESGSLKINKSDKENLKQSIKLQLIKKSPKLEDLLRNKVVHPINVIFTSREGLVVSPSSGKVIEVCDNRI